MPLSNLWATVSPLETTTFTFMHYIHHIKNPHVVEYKSDSLSQKGDKMLPVT